MRDLVKLYFADRNIVNHHISSFDDFLATPDIIEGLAAFLQEHPDLDCSYADVVYVRRDAPDKILRLYSSKNFSPSQLAGI